MANWQDIKVSSKILGHISAGIYRSPAGAIKELVSNAFDADATRVTITTNWPSFDIITCRDNGTGMTEEKFRDIMTREIGDSAKRVTKEEDPDDVTDQGRPIIGWLGIGMLGVAQICHEFKIISHHKETQKAFSATIRLADFLRERVSETSPEEVSNEPIDVGQFESKRIEYDSDKVGTYMVASDMRAAFIRKFRDNSGRDPLPLKFSEFLKTIHIARSVKSLSEYWQMVWELTLACPIPYTDEEVFDWSKIEVEPELKKYLTNLQKSLNEYRFQVVVDGLSLCKPNRYPLFSPQLPKQKYTTGRLFSVNETIEVYGQTLKLSGYIYLQNSRAIEPMELRGLLIRIRNIAIGTYDSTLLKYPIVPSPRFNWLSGEIYVEEGLEFALNIDRDSFNEIHPHFVKLKEIIHNLLSEKVFPEAGRAQRKKSEALRQEKEHKRQITFESLIHEELGGSYVSNSNDEQRFPLTIDTDQEMLLVNDQSDLLPKSKNKRKLIQYIAHAFEISMLAPEQERRDKFYQLLSEFVKLDLL